MRKLLRIFLLAFALALLPACSALRLESPAAAGRTLDQRAYALLNTYAAVIEEATDIARDPATPNAFIRVLAEAERAATPAIEALEFAVAAYVGASADMQTASAGDQTQIERAASTLAAAARRLSEAVLAAEGPVAELQGLVDARGGG